MKPLDILSLSLLALSLLIPCQQVDARDMVFQMNGRGSGAVLAGQLHVTGSGDQLGLVHTSDDSDSPFANWQSVTRNQAGQAVAEWVADNTRGLRGVLRGERSLSGGGRVRAVVQFENDQRDVQVDYYGLDGDRAVWLGAEAGSRVDQSAPALRPNEALRPSTDPTSSGWRSASDAGSSRWEGGDNPAPSSSETPVNGAASSSGREAGRATNNSSNPAADREANDGGADDASIAPAAPDNKKSRWGWLKRLAAGAAAALGAAGLVSLLPFAGPAGIAAAAGAAAVIGATGTASEEKSPSESRYVYGSTVAKAVGVMIGANLLGAFSPALAMGAAGAGLGALGASLLPRSVKAGIAKAARKTIDTLIVNPFKAIARGVASLF